MILKISSVSIGCIMLNNLVSCLISANTLSQNTQCGIGLLTKTFKLCFLTMCYDVNCACVGAKKETFTSLNTTTEKNTNLNPSDAPLICTIFNTRINETKNRQTAVQTRGMLCRLNNRMKFNRIVYIYIFIESLK